MYMPGRRRTASRPSSTVIERASYPPFAGFVASPDVCGVMAADNREPLVVVLGQGAWWAVRVVCFASAIPARQQPGRAAQDPLRSVRTDDARPRVYQADPSDNGSQPPCGLRTSVLGGGWQKAAPAPEQAPELA